MKLKDIPDVVWLMAGGVLLLWWIKSRGAGSVGSDIGGAVVDAVTGTVGGVVVGIGEAVGIPKTNQQMCDISKRNGNVMDASKYCTASDFISWNLNGRPKNGATGSW